MLVGEEEGKPIKMEKRYKIKLRDPKWGSIPERGYYIYSRLYSRCKNGRLGFRRYLMAGPFSLRHDAVIQAGLMALKFDEFARKMQKKSVQP